MNKEDLFRVLDGEVGVDNVEKWKAKHGKGQEHCLDFLHGRLKSERGIN